MAKRMIFHDTHVLDFTPVLTPVILLLCIHTLLNHPLACSFFFCFSYSHVAYLDYGGALFDRFPAAVRGMAARCKLSFALRPGLSHENEDNK
jgi:hypothetical protein